MLWRHLIKVWIPDDNLSNDQTGTLREDERIGRNFGLLAYRTKLPPSKEGINSGNNSNHPLGIPLSRVPYGVGGALLFLAGGWLAERTEYRVGFEGRAIILASFACALLLLSSGVVLMFYGWS